MKIKNFDSELTLRERAEKLAATQGWTVAQLQKECGLSNAYFSNVMKVTPRIAMRIRSRIPNASMEYLNEGKGSVLYDVADTVEVNVLQVPLLPISAQGGTLNDFEAQIQSYDCEMIISPIKEATLAITITGDSMSPEYPGGCKVLVRKINEAAFIEWGRTYVLDTVNGAIIKNIFPSQTDKNKIICRSVNPNFPDFEVEKTDIRGWYRVLMNMALK